MDLSGVKGVQKTVFHTEKKTQHTYITHNRMVFDDILKLPASPAEFMKQKQALQAHALRARMRAHATSPVHKKQRKVPDFIKRSHLVAASPSGSPIRDENAATPPAQQLHSPLQTSRSPAHSSPSSHNTPKASVLIQSFNRRHEQFMKEQSGTEEFFKSRKSVLHTPKKALNSAAVSSPSLGTRSPLQTIATPQSGNSRMGSPVPSSPLYTPTRNSNYARRSPVTVFNDCVEKLEEREKLRREMDEVKTRLDRVKSNMQNDLENQLQLALAKQRKEQRRKVKKQKRLYEKQLARLMGELEEVRRTSVEKQAALEWMAREAAEKREREIRDEMEQVRLLHTNTIRKIREEHARETSVLEEKIEELVVSLQHAKDAEKDALEQLQDREGRLKAMREKHQQFVDRVRQQITEIQEDVQNEKSRWQNERKQFEETITQKENLITLLYREKTTFESDLLAIRCDQERQEPSPESLQSADSSKEQQNPVLNTPIQRLQRLRRDINNTSQALTNSPTATRLREMLSPKALRRKSIKPFGKNRGNGEEFQLPPECPPIPTESLVERMLRMDSSNDAEVLSPGRAHVDNSHQVASGVNMEEIDLTSSNTSSTGRRHQRSKSMSKLLRKMRANKRQAKAANHDTTVTADEHNTADTGKSRKRSYELVGPQMAHDEQKLEQPKSSTPKHKRFKTIF